MEAHARLLVVIVAFNSGKTLAATLAALAGQLTAADEVIVFDNASDRPVELDHFPQANITCLRSEKNLGFCGGNNAALAARNWRRFKFVLLLNPDVVLPQAWVEAALGKMTRLRISENLGILSGPLIKYDFELQTPLPTIDSLGITRSRWTGLWRDIGQGAPLDKDQLSRPWTLKLSEQPQAICGALMLIDAGALEQVAGEQDEVFDEYFFAYKEDIDLSLRFRKAGYSLRMDPALYAFHGRGWSKSRAMVSQKLKLLSARNDIYLNWKYGSPYLLLSIAKYVVVLISKI